MLFISGRHCDEVFTFNGNKTVSDNSLDSLVKGLKGLLAGNAICIFGLQDWTHVWLLVMNNQSN